MRLFSIGCRDSGNVLKPKVTILSELKTVSLAESVLRGRCRGAHGSVGHPIQREITNALFLLRFAARFGGGACLDCGVSFVADAAGQVVKPRMTIASTLDRFPQEIEP
jgi:hypothetical protein